MNILSIIKNFFDLIQIKFYCRKFRSYKDLEKFCQGKSNYENEANFKFRYNKFILNKDHITSLYKYQYQILLKTIDEFIRKYEYFPKILDFGGGFGEGYFFLKKFYSDQEIQYSVVEIPKIVKLNANKDNNNLFFHSSLKSALEKGNSDLIFSSSTLQYLKDPYLILDEFNSSKVKMISLTRNSFSQKTMYYSQVSKLYSSGGGISPKSYANILTIHPHTVIDINKLENIINNYKIIFREKTLEKTVFPNCFSEDLMFVKKN